MTEYNTALAGEIATIETTMRDNPEAYWRDQEMQGRYRNALARRDGTELGEVDPREVGRPAPDESARQRAPGDNAGQQGSYTPLSVAEARRNLQSTPAGRELLEDWGEHADLMLARSQQNMAAFLNGMSPAAQREVLAQYDKFDDRKAVELIHAFAIR